jgi:hypothetical protein
MLIAWWMVAVAFQVNKVASEVSHMVMRNNADLCSIVKRLKFEAYDAKPVKIIFAK